MSEIQDIKRTVDTAQHVFARVSEQHDRSKKHLMSITHIIEERLHERRVQLAQNETERTRLGEEYAQLTQMLHALILTIHCGSERDGHNLVPSPNVEARAGNSTVLVPVAPAANDAAPSETVPVDPQYKTSPEELRAGLKRVLKIQRAQKSKKPRPQDTTPAE